MVMIIFVSSPLFSESFYKYINLHGWKGMLNLFNVMNNENSSTESKLSTDGQMKSSSFTVSNCLTAPSEVIQVPWTKDCRIKWRLSRRSQDMLHGSHSKGSLKRIKLLNTNTKKIHKKLIDSWCTIFKTKMGVIDILSIGSYLI